MSPHLAATAVSACALAAAAAGCGSSKTEDDVVRAVPADARAYVHLDRGAEDWDRAREALRRLPALEDQVLQLLRGVADVPGDGEAGLALLPGRAAPAVLYPKSPPVERSLGGDRDYDVLLRGLPDQRFVHGYLSRELLGPLRAIDSSIAAAAGGADIDGDRLLLRAQLRHDRIAGPCHAIRGGDDLLEIADPGAAVYLEVPSMACAIQALATRFEGVGTAVGRFGRAAQRRGGVSLEEELEPLLRRRGALIAVPGDGAPTITLIVDGVDEQRALDVLSRLQPAIIHLLRSEELGQAPTFGAAEVEGITAATAQIAPGLELSYAAWDDRLVVSTALEGIASARRAEGLPGTDAFEAVLGDRPSDPSALVFLDLNQLLALGEQAGLAEDPRYLAIRDDLQKLRAAGAVLSREEKFTTAELTFQIP